MAENENNKLYTRILTLLEIYFFLSIKKIWNDSIKPNYEGNKNA